MGNLKGLVQLMKEIVPEKRSRDVDISKKGKFTLRDMYEQFEAVLKMGPLNKGTLPHCMYMYIHE